MHTSSFAALLLPLGLGSLLATALFLPANHAQAEDSTPFALRPISEVKTQVGKASQVEVVIAVDAPYKCNADYPHKAENIQGADLGTPAQVKGGCKEALKGAKAKDVTFLVPVTGQKAGTYTLQGTARFSVCSDEQCLIEKVPFRTVVVVTP